MEAGVQFRDVQQALVVYGSHVPIAAENLLEFHLLYSGPLHSAGSGNPRLEKHRIRQALHPQLRRLWSTHPNLCELAELHSDTQDNFERGISVLSRRWNRNGYNFLPLVTADVCLRCSLEILFLRVEEKNYILQSGDIDGRLKILFDGLRMIQEGNELPPGAVPQEGEDPFFCLLQNDDLISEVRINTGQLLQLPNKQVEKHDVYLEIAVKLNTTRPHEFNWVF